MPRKKTMGRAANGNGTIRKKTVTKNGTEYTSWEGRVTVGYDPGTGKQIQKSVSGKTQKEVRQKLSKIIVELDEGTYQAPCKLTVKEWLESWLTDYLGNVKPSTALLYRQQAELYIIPKLGALKVEALTSDQVQKFYNELFRSKEDGGKGLSAKTVKNVHGVFHKALEQAKKNHILRFNPSDACELPRIYKQEIKPLNREQAGAFLREIQGHTHEYLFCIALFTVCVRVSFWASLGTVWTWNTGLSRSSASSAEKRKRVETTTFPRLRTTRAAFYPWLPLWFAGFAGKS